MKRTLRKLGAAVRAAAPLLAIAAAVGAAHAVIGVIAQRDEQAVARDRIDSRAAKPRRAQPPRTVRA